MCIYELVKKSLTFHEPSESFLNKTRFNPINSTWNGYDIPSKTWTHFKTNAYMFQSLTVTISKFFLSVHVCVYVCVCVRFEWDKIMYWRTEHRVCGIQETDIFCAFTYQYIGDTSYSTDKVIGLTPSCFVFT